MAEEQGTTQAVATAKGSDEQELVTCILDDVEFGLDINAVQEIVRLPKITPVPKAPAYVTGVANLRGNVLPIINSRRRFGMTANDNKDNGRVIVVELNGSPTGLIVDAVREVMHIKRSDVEKTPPAVHGVDSKFLKGIVKLDDGKRLVMLLDHNRVLDLGDFVARGESEARGGVAAHGRETSNRAIEDDNEQLVTFRVANEEYGISIMDVQEIIRVPEITKVPHAPPGLEGVTSLRNRVLPVMDLRTKFGIRTLKDETDALLAQLRAMLQVHEQWLSDLQAASADNKPFTGELDPQQCEFGRWLRSFSTTDRVIADLLKPLRESHERFHALAKPVLSCIKAGDLRGAAAYVAEHVQPAFAELSGVLKKLTTGITSREDERCLVVSIGRTALAVRIDAVNEVLQVPKTSVEPTPEVVSGHGATKDQIRGVAKLDDGKRLIMLLDVQKLVTETELQVVSGAEQEGEQASANEGATRMSTTTEGDERQLVGFKVAAEEFAFDIMNVQEIVRLGKVTKVPHAPSFVEGVVNLRGNVLPVIDLRRRFDLPTAEYNDATRVVVVDIRGKKTGIIVDSVSEVMRLPKSNIEPAPAIVAAGCGQEFVEGVGKINQGERMLLLLRADKLLSDEEVGSLSRLAEETAGTDDCSESNALN